MLLLFSVLPWLRRSVEPAEWVCVVGKCVAKEGPTLGGTWKEQNEADLFRGSTGILSYAVFNDWRGGAESLDIRLLVHQVLVGEPYIPRVPGCPRERLQVTFILPSTGHSVLSQGHQAQRSPGEGFLVQTRSPYTIE